MMKEDRIGLIFAEVNSVEMYKDLPPYDEVFKFLRENNFLLVGLYKMHFRHRIAGWGDVLFINKRLHASRLDRR